MLLKKWFKSSTLALMLMSVQCTHLLQFVHWTNINISMCALDLNHFSCKKTCAFIEQRIQFHFQIYVMQSNKTGNKLHRPILEIWAIKVGRVLKKISHLSITRFFYFLYILSTTYHLHVVSEWFFKLCIYCSMSNP